MESELTATPSPSWRHHRDDCLHDQVQLILHKTYIAFFVLWTCVSVTTLLGLPFYYLSKKSHLRHCVVESRSSEARAWAGPRVTQLLSVQPPSAAHNLSDGNMTPGSQHLSNSLLRHMWTSYLDARIAEWQLVFTRRNFCRVSYLHSLDMQVL
jgi:hypothetical protein